MIPWITLVLLLVSRFAAADDSAQIDALLAKAGRIPAGRFEFITTSKGPKGITVVNEIMRVYRKGERWRFESRNITPGQYTLILPGEYYSCLPGPEGCRKLERSDVTDDAFFNRVIDPTKYSKSRKIVGHADLEGKVCTVIEVMEGPDDLPYRSKVWIWNDTGIPLRIESQALPESQDKAGKAQWPTYENKNFAFEDVPDSLFEEHPVRRADP